MRLTNSTDSSTTEARLPKSHLSVTSVSEMTPHVSRATVHTDPADTTRCTKKKQQNSLENVSWWNKKSAAATACTHGMLFFVW